MMKIDFTYRVSKFTNSWINGRKRLWIIILLVIILFILIAFEFQAKEKIDSNENTQIIYQVIESELILLPFCGHMPQEEKPNEVARKLEEFMKNLKGE